jgi:hypothetical protein
VEAVGEILYYMRLGYLALLLNKYIDS